MKHLIEHWKSILQIEDWEITTQRIESGQIDYDDQNYFIGIERNFEIKQASYITM
jgi:extradiol dioxygenase family protein